MIAKEQYNKQNVVVELNFADSVFFCY